MRKMPPCKPEGIDCEKRCPGCQDHCEEFCKWKDAEKKVAEAKQAEQDSRTDKRSQPYWRKYDRLNRKK